jgi:hypothetical protein
VVQSAYSKSWVPLIWRANAWSIAMWKSVAEGVSVGSAKTEAFKEQAASAAQRNPRRT